MFCFKHNIFFLLVPFAYRVSDPISNTRCFKFWQQTHQIIFASISTSLDILRNLLVALQNCFVLLILTQVSCTQHFRLLKVIHSNQFVTICICIFALLGIFNVPLLNVLLVNWIRLHLFKLNQYFVIVVIITSFLKCTFEWTP